MSVLLHDAVQRFFQRHPASGTIQPQSTGTGGPDPRVPPASRSRADGAGIAVFDCDGTLIKGDVGEAMLYFQMEEFLFRHSPAALWPDHPDRERLDALYRSLLDCAPSGRTSHPAFGQFADIILDWYFGQIEAGAVAKACTDIVRLFAGFTPAEVRRIALRSYRRERAAPLSTRMLGRRMVPSGIRYIREAVELLTALCDRGFQIWAVSGSNKWSVEPVFAKLGIPAEQVIGIELLERDGILIPDPVQPVPIRKEKVGAMQKRIPGVPVFCASDSRNDIPLLLYSSDLKVRINTRGRDAGEFFEAVGAPPDASWVNVENPTIINEGEL